MKTHIIQIGNSKGIRIPKSMLEECHLENEIDISIQKNHLVIKPVKSKRKNWTEAFKKMSQNNDDVLLMDIVDDDKDWEW